MHLSTKSNDLLTIRITFLDALHQGSKLICHSHENGNLIDA